MQDNTLHFIPPIRSARIFLRKLPIMQNSTNINLLLFSRTFFFVFEKKIYLDIFSISFRYSKYIFFEDSYKLLTKRKRCLHSQNKNKIIILLLKY